MNEPSSAFAHPRTQVRAPSPLAVRLLPVGIVLVTLIAFLPVLQNGFVAFDDGPNIINNLNYRGLDWTHLQWMLFKSVDMGVYIPLSWVTLGLDYLIWGMNPFGYHLTNLLLHLLNAVLFFFLTRDLLAPCWPALGAKEYSELSFASGIAALLFSVHPLRVESVAWATERRDLLSCVFFLLTLRAYLKSNSPDVQGKRRQTWLIVSWGFYLLSLLSKGIGMTLPLILVLLDVYPLKRLGGIVTDWFKRDVWQVWLEKIPFILLALPTIWVAGYSQLRLGAAVPLSLYGPLQRLALTCYGIGFYIRKTILPLGLRAVYELPPQFHTTDPPFLASILLAFFVSLLLYLQRRRWPSLLATWTYYVIILLPVSGIFQSGPHRAADRISYFSCLGWAVLAGGVFFSCWQALKNKKWGRPFSRVATGIILALLATLVALTRQQCKYWHDDKSLWTHAVECDPDDSVIQNNVGAYYSIQGMKDEALSHFQRALRLNQNYPDPYCNIGAIYFKLNQWDEAVTYLQKAVELKPDLAEAHFFLAHIFMAQGRAEEAVQHYQQWLELPPNTLTNENSLFEAYFNLGVLLISQHRIAEAAWHFRRATELQPQSAVAFNNLGSALVSLGLTEEGIQQYQKALALDPGKTLTRKNLEIARRQMERKSKI